MSRKEKNARQCISCREIKNKADLIRITKKYDTGEVVINNDGKAFGRSVYICKNTECIEKAIKKQKIDNALKVKVSETFKANLCT